MQCDAIGYGIEGEQLALAVKNGLRVMEVPVSINYRGLTRTSKKSPLLHGGDLILTLFRLVVEERPLKYLGIPGIGLTFIGMILGMYLLWMFNLTRFFSLSIALIAAGASILGILLVIAAITLQALKRINEKLSKIEQKRIEF